MFSDVIDEILRAREIIRVKKKKKNLNIYVHVLFLVNFYLLMSRLKEE